MWDKRGKREKCLLCERSNIKHKGNGLCLYCYAKRRRRNPIVREKQNKLRVKWYAKQKDNPEFKKANYERSLKYQKTEKYKKCIKEYCIKDKFKRFIKRQKNGLEIFIDGEKIRTPILPPERVNETETDDIPDKIKLFKEVYNKYFKKNENNT